LRKGKTAIRKMSEMPSAGQEKHTGLAPIFDAQVQCLILGSFPSPASLKAQAYYGHRQNQFWRLLGAILAEPLDTLSYSERIRRVLDHHVGIWDVYRACIRPGALDADIRAGETNDFSFLLRQTPHLRTVAFNGKTAARFAPRLRATGQDLGLPLEIQTLPSSSPAYTLAFAEKLQRWQDVLRNGSF
jgi:hypoxanthine-DNA glycosylase